MPDKRIKGRKISNNEISINLRGGPATLSELARKINRTASSLQRPLQKMIEEELIFREGDKYYLKGVGASENIILEKLSEGPKTPTEIFSEDVIRSYYSTVEGLEKDLGKLSRFVDKKEGKYSLNSEGAIKINLCPFCFKKVEPAEERKVRLFRSDFTWTAREEDHIWISGEIHLECFHKLLVERLPTSELFDANYCHFCGLPLNPLLLEEYFVNTDGLLNEFTCHLNQIEEWCFRQTFSLRPEVLKTRYEVEKLYQTRILDPGTKTEEYRGYFKSLDVSKRIDALWDKISTKLDELKKRAESWIEKLCGIPTLFYRNMQIFYAGDTDYERRTKIMDTFLWNKYSNSKDENFGEWIWDGIYSHFDAAHSLVFSDPKGHQYHLYCYQLQRQMDKTQEGRQ